MIYKKLGNTNLIVSRLGLGTAEIGFKYGIKKTNLPSEKEAIQLLKTAVDLGITFFDTANFYGLSEERLGKSGISKMDNIIIATKCGHFLEKGEDFSGTDLENKLRDEIKNSLKVLKLDFLPLVQLHGGNKENIEKGELIEVFKKFKKEGLIKYTGISVRGEESAIAAIESNFFDTVQVAYSIIDQRMKKNALPLAKEKNIGIINRSVLLKGSLTRAASLLPESLSPLKEASNKSNLIAQKLNIDLPTLAIRFALSEDAITTSLIGTNKIENLKKVCSAIDAGPLPKDVVKELNELALSEEKYVDPAKWPQIKIN